MSQGDVSLGARAEVRALLVDHLQSVHALKAGALKMFQPMLASVRRERLEGDLVSVDDLLGRMLEAFGQHCRETKRHEALLRQRLEALGQHPSRGRLTGFAAAARARAALGAIGGQNHGRNARDAYIFEHLEIASFELLARLAERAGDVETAALARSCRAEDEQMAEKIERNWSNVLNLMLASQGIDDGRRDADQEAHLLRSGEHAAGDAGT